jgi:hypothetical protein
MEKEYIMASNFRKNLNLQVVAYVVATLLLWAGLSFAPSYADEAEVTYYAFVTYKLEGESAWKTAYQFPLLHPGIYRFQIVMFPKSLEGKSPNWYALRGEIEFETDPGGGVKVKKRHTLEDQEETSGLWAIAETTETAPLNNWAFVRQEKLLPIIERMKLLKKGSPDPNIMRFLLLYQKAKDSWQLAGKKYRLYRLHYLEAELINNNKYKTALSRFLNPGEEPTTDIEQLQEWLDEQDSFKSAGYLGKPDDKHKEFYAAFKTWFNQLNFSQPDEEEDNGEESSSWLWLVLGVLFVIIVAVIGREVWVHAERAPSRLSGYDDDDDTEEGIRKPSLFNQLKQKTAATIANRTTKSSNDYVSKTELKQLMKKLANNVQPLENRLTKLEKEFSSANLHIKQQLEVMNKKLIELEKQPKTAPSQRGGNQVSSTAMMSSYVSKAEFADAVEKVIRQKLLTQTEKLQNLSKSESVENIVRQQLNLYFGTEQFQRTVADQLEFSTKTNPYLKNQTPALPKKAPQPLQETKPIVNTAAEPTQESQPPNTTTNDVIDKIKTVLLSMKSVEEAALNTLDANVEPCTFVANVVANGLEPNQPATHYQRLDRSIQEITDGKVSLIIPNVGEDINQDEHNATSTQTATKGKQNTIASLIRPGVKCDNDIRCRAEVVQTV